LAFATLFSFGGYGLALVVFGAIECPLDSLLWPAQSAGQVKKMLQMLRKFLGVLRKAIIFVISVILVESWRFNIGLVASKSHALKRKDKI